MLLRLAIILLIYVSTCSALAADLPRAAVTGWPVLLPQTGHQQAVTAMAFSPDGRTLATNGAEGTVKLWDVPSRKLMRTLEIGGRGVESLSWSPDGRELAGCGELGNLFLWSADGELLRRWQPEGGQAYAVALMNGGKAVVAGRSFATLPERRGSAIGLRVTGRSFVTLLDPASLRPAWRVDLDWTEALNAAVAAGGRTIGVVGSRTTGGSANEAELALLDAKTGACRHSLGVRSARFFSARCSPDGKLLAIGGFDYRSGTGAAWIVDTASGRLVRDIHPGASDVPSVAFSSDGQALVLGCEVGESPPWRGSVQEWSLRTGFKLREWRAPGSSSERVAASPVSGAIAAAGELYGDTPIRFLHPKTLRLVASLPHLRSHVTLLGPSPDGRLLAFAGASEELMLWDRDTGRLRQVAPPLEEAVRTCHWSPDGALMLTNGSPEGFALLDLRTGNRIVDLADGKGIVVAHGISPDGQRATGFQLMAFKELQLSGDTLLWDTHSGALVRRLIRTEGMRFSPSGKLLAGFAVHEADGEVPGRPARTLTVWDASTGAAIREFGEATSFQFMGSSDRMLRQDSAGFAVCNPSDGSVLHIAPAMDLYALTPDGDRLIIADSYQPVRLIDTRTGRYLQTRPAPNTSLRSLDLSPDGKTAAFGTDAAGVVLLNLESGETQVVGGERTDEIRSTQFSPDGCTVLGRSHSGIRLWDTHTGGLLLFAASHLRCDFAPDGHSLLLETLDGTLRVVDAHSGKERVTLASFPRSAGTQQVWLAFTPDGAYAGSDGAERFLAGWIWDRVLPGTAMRGSRVPDLLKYVPWSFGERQARVEEAEALLTGLPYWSGPGQDDAKLLRGLEELCRFDTITLREALRRTVVTTTTDDLARYIAIPLNGMILNRYLFQVPAAIPKQAWARPQWPLYGDTQGRWRLVPFRGWDGSLGDPLWEFDRFRRYYPRRPPEAVMPE